jgi:hypothetical protein
MATLRRFCIERIASIAALCVVSAGAFASDDCDISKTCTVSQYDVFFVKSSYQCPPYGALTKECREVWEPPYPATLNCESNYSGFLCESWPQGSTLRYGYSASGSISIPYPVPADVALANVSCWGSGAGSLTVTITSTSAPGQSSVVTRDLYCP